MSQPSDPNPPAPMSLAERRLMLVHAHPDDECSSTGTMAKYAAAGAAVTLVTCTLGEEGEVLVPGLAHLAAAEADELGEHRLAELSAAMAVLGVTDFVRLGGDHRFRDSGMRWTEDGVQPVEDAAENTFWRSDLLVAADELVPLIRDRRPQVIVTYDHLGGYGHPDHIQAHRVATYAATLAGTSSYRLDLGAPWQIGRLVWTAWSASAARAMVREARAAGNDDFFGGMDPDGDLPPMFTPDELLDCTVDARSYADHKVGALRAHATQVDVDNGFFAHIVGRDEWAVESYRLAFGTPFPPGATDLFAGLDDADPPLA